MFNNLENFANQYFIPKSAKSVNVKDAYKDFYIDNLSTKKEILVSLDKFNEKLDEYFEEKYEKDGQKNQNQFKCDIILQ